MRTLKRLARLILTALRCTKPAPAGVVQAVAESEGRPRRLAYIDVDRTGLFARLVHATSSAHADRIRASGLMPLRDMRQAVGDYMLALEPELGELEGGIDAILDTKEPHLRRSMGGQFLYARLECEADDPRLHLLPLIGGSVYLDSAAENAVEDGGEVFKAARLVLKEYLGRPIGPRYPGATALIVSAKCYFKEEGGLLHLTGVDGYPAVAASDALPTAFPEGIIELRVRERVGPDCLEFYPYAEYRPMMLERASEAGEARLTEIRNAAGCS